MKRWTGWKDAWQGLAQSKDMWNDELIRKCSGNEKEINRVLLNVIEI